MRAYVGQLTVHFGPATTTGSLLPVQGPDRSPDIKLCTPDGRPVKQVYKDDNGTFYEWDALGRAVVDEDGNYEMIDLDVLKAAKESTLPKNVMSVSAHPTDEVTAHLHPSDHKSYILTPVIKGDKNKVKPDPINDKWYDFITTVVRDAEGITFLSLANVRGHEGLYRFGIYQGHLMLQRMLWPEDLNQFEQIRPELKPTEHEKALRIAAKMVEHFDPASYSDRTPERVKIALASGAAPEIAEPELDSFDLEAALDAFE